MWKVPGNITIGKRKSRSASSSFLPCCLRLPRKPADQEAGDHRRHCFQRFVLRNLHCILSTASHANGRASLKAWISFASTAIRNWVAEPWECGPANVLVAVRDPRNLYYLRHILEPHEYHQAGRCGDERSPYHREHSFSGSTVFEASQVFDHYEQELFTAAVAVAEKEGKPISLLVVPATDVFEAIMVTAQRLDSSRVICGLSNKLTADEQAKLTGDAWERLPEPRPRLTLEVCAPDGSIREYSLGPHTPRMRGARCRTHAQAVARYHGRSQVRGRASLPHRRAGAGGIAARVNHRAARRNSCKNCTMK